MSRMESIEINIVNTCNKCEKDFEIFDNDLEVDYCNECKNKCEECGKRAIYNYVDKDFGIRCGSHVLDNMKILNYIEIFSKNIEKLGGKVTGKYKTSSNPVDCICKNGHKCTPIPSNIRRGNGMCRICVGLDPEIAGINFAKLIEELGGVVIGKYINAKTNVPCRCKNGHECNPNPGDIQQGQGMCKICAGHDAETAMQNFIRRIEELEGKVIGEYVNAKCPVECRCKNGHKCYPIPSNIQTGYGLCSSCKNKTEAKLLAFLENIIKPNDIITQFKPEWCKNEETACFLPFDLLLSQYKIIIELDGRQHFEDVKYWHSSYEDCSDRDIYKMKQALNNGYSIIRIFQEEVWTDSYDWKSVLISVIKECKDTTEPITRFISKDENIYDNHKAKIKN